MSTYQSQYYSASGALPIPSAKASYTPYPTYYPSGDSTYSVSPPEDLDASVTSGSSSAMVGGGAVSAYGNSSTYSVPASSYYAGSSSSQGEYDSAGSASGIDLNEYMSDRFAETFNPLPLDKCTAVQAQT